MKCWDELCKFIVSVIMILFPKSQLSNYAFWNCLVWQNVETSKSAHIFIIICYALFWLLKICFNYVLNKFTHFHVVSFKICACALMRHFLKACKNFDKARCLWCAEKLFWFIAKILDFVIYKSSASNGDSLRSR